MMKTTTKTPILQRTALIIAMSAVSFPSYALGTGDDTYTGADEGQVIINNRDRSIDNSNRIGANEPFIQELRDLRNNPPTPPVVPPGPTIPTGPAPQSSQSLEYAPISGRKCSETFENEIRDIEYTKLGVDIVQIGIEAAGEAVQGLPFGAGMAGGAVVVASLAAQAVNAALGFVVLDKDADAADAPSCGQEFVGDVEVTEGANVVVSGVNGGTVSLGPDSNGNLQPGVSIGGGQITGAGDSVSNRLAVAAHATAIAIGNSAQAMAVNSTAIGESAIADGVNSSSYGGQSQARGSDSTALGQDAIANKKNATATGVSSRATGENSTATGRGTQASGENATATGASSRATALSSTATGQNAQAIEENATALGQGALSDKKNTTATGASSRATGLSSTANGQDAQATNTNTIATGVSSRATGLNSTANGQNAQAIEENATALDKVH